MSNSSLLAVQRLQFTDRGLAEQQLETLLRQQGFDDLVKVRLNPKPESLNSVNGFADFVDGSTLFFKSHVEENEVLAEYYRREILEQAGYPVVHARQVKSIPGEQIAFYEVLSFPTLFDLVHEHETSGSCEFGSDTLLQAQQGLDDRIFEIYRATLREATAEECAEQPIHQLFYHRIAGAATRYEQFYRNAQIEIGAEAVPFSELETMHWRINGVDYAENLQTLRSRAVDLLLPARSTAVIAGHGDAHNGNVFFDPSCAGLLYFDPAFAGAHDPLLDIVKPLFHNVFARWMYFPELVEKEFSINATCSGSTVTISHTFEPSALRKGFFDSKLSRVVYPLLQLLKERQFLDSDWKERLQLALFCCPLLTVNLAASYTGTGKLAERYTQAIKLLGFAMAIECAATPVSGNQADNSIRGMLNLLREEV